jgi:hypothetical protein
VRGEEGGDPVCHRLSERIGVRHAVVAELHHEREAPILAEKGVPEAPGLV